MAVRFRIRLKQDGTETFKNKILNIHSVRERFVNDASEKILAEARLNAPIDVRPGHIGGELRESGKVVTVTRSAKTTTNRIQFIRTGPGPGYLFDVADWLHNPEDYERTTYTPSSPDERVGPKYVNRAYASLQDQLHVEFLESVHSVVVR